MADTIQRYLLNKEVVVCAADTKELVNVARELHGTYPVCTAALGRTLTGAAMMASTAIAMNMKGSRGAYNAQPQRRWSGGHGARDGQRRL